MASYFTIIIPWQDRGEEDRRKAFDFAVDYYAMLGCEVVIGDDGHEGPLNRSKLRNAGAAKAKGSVFVFIDADTLVPFDQINQAVRQVGLSGSAVLPYNIGCTYLDQARTETLYQAGPRADWRRLGIDETTNWSYIGADGEIPEDLLVGPAIAVSRTAFARLNGFHEGFVGWGEEERDFLFRMSRSYRRGGRPRRHAGALPQHIQPRPPARLPAGHSGADALPEQPASVPPAPG